jgi:iron complex outermembrane receptor protein
VDPEARALLDEGASAYARGDFTGAIAAFERGYAIDPAPVFLYAWAQAARYAGDCVTAVELYDRFLASEPPAAQRSAAEGYRAKCAATLPPADPPSADANVAAPTTVATSSVPPPSDAAPDEVTARPRRDRVGPALLGLGVGIALAGIGLSAVGVDAVVRQSDTTAYQDFRDLDRRKRTFFASGVPILAVGIALVIGGAIRLVRMRRARDMGTTARLAWTR